MSRCGRGTSGSRPRPPTGRSPRTIRPVTSTTRATSAPSSSPTSSACGSCGRRGSTRSGSGRRTSSARSASRSRRRRGTRRRFILDRYFGSRDFSERDRTVLDLLRPHFARLWHAADTRRRLRAALDGLDAASEQEARGVIVLTSDGRIAFASPPARRLLRDYVGEGRGPELLPGLRTGSSPARPSWRSPQATAASPSGGTATRSCSRRNAGCSTCPRAKARSSPGSRAARRTVRSPSCSGSRRRRCGST